MALSVFITLALCELLLASSMNFLPASYFFFLLYEQSCTYLSWDETDFRWTKRVV